MVVLHKTYKPHWSRTWGFFSKLRWRWRDPSLLIVLIFVSLNDSRPCSCCFLVLSSEMSVPVAFTSVDFRMLHFAKFNFSKPDTDTWLFKLVLHTHSGCFLLTFGLNGLRVNMRRKSKASSKYHAIIWISQQCQVKHQTPGHLLAWKINWKSRTLEFYVVYWSCFRLSKWETAPAAVQHGDGVHGPDSQGADGVRESRAVQLHLRHPSRARQTHVQGVLVCSIISSNLLDIEGPVCAFRFNVTQMWFLFSCHGRPF